MGKFSDKIAAFNKKAQTSMRAAAREATQETVVMAQLTRGNGGRMRVKTGFLRASIQASESGMPSGPTTNQEGQMYPVGTQVTGEPVSVALLRWDPNTGRPIYLGWTANYARHREYKDGFLRGAVSQWDRTVDKIAKRVRRRLG